MPHKPRESALVPSEDAVREGLENLLSDVERQQEKTHHRTIHQTMHEPKYTRYAYEILYGRPKQHLESWTSACITVDKDPFSLGIVIEEITKRLLVIHHIMIFHTETCSRCTCNVLLLGRSNRNKLGSRQNTQISDEGEEKVSGNIETCAMASRKKKRVES